MITHSSSLFNEESGCDHSVDHNDDNIIIKRVKPQHLIGVEDSTERNKSREPVSILKSGMNSSRKRPSQTTASSNLLDLSSSTTSSNTSQSSLSASADIISSTIHQQQQQPSCTPPNKKRLVSFCKKSSATSKNSGDPKQCPFLANMNKISSIQKTASCTSLPNLVASTSSTSISTSVSHASTGELDLSTSPADFIKTILLQSGGGGTMRGEDIISSATQRVQEDSYFVTYTNEHLDAYTHDMNQAVHGNDVKCLRSLLQSGHTMQASNRFGESMIHTSCRRGFTDMVQFFLHEAKVSPRVRDDMGRTPMHDACWSSSAPSDIFDMMRTLIELAPELLLSKDKRGHSPFDYARREYWPQWVTFLNDNRQFIVKAMLASCQEDCGMRKPIVANEVVGDEYEVPIRQ